MTQPAKVQEPSMEEILASIRRIIADDEAKPPVAEKVMAPAPASEPAKPAASPPKPVAITDVPAPNVAPVSKAPPPPAAPSPPPAPVPSNNQEDIDSLLADLDEATPPEALTEPEPEPEVFELTDDMAVVSPPSPSPPQSAFRKVEPDDDLEFTETAGVRANGRQPMFEQPIFSAPAAAPAQPPILSQSTISAVESAFNTLAHTVLSNNARTLEDLVKEMLRPMLKSWLDDNLPSMVERIVKAEIERVSRGR